MTFKAYGSFVTSKGFSKHIECEDFFPHELDKNNIPFVLFLTA